MAERRRAASYVFSKQKKASGRLPRGMTMDSPRWKKARCLLAGQDKNRDVVNWLPLIRRSVNVALWLYNYKWWQSECDRLAGCSQMKFSSKARQFSKYWKTGPRTYCTIGANLLPQNVRLAATIDTCRNSDKSSVDNASELMSPIKVPSTRPKLATSCRSIRRRNNREQIGKPISGTRNGAGRAEEGRRSGTMERARAAVEEECVRSAPRAVAIDYSMLYGTF
jgi:hypothetical protein